MLYVFSGSLRLFIIHSSHYSSASSFSTSYPLPALTESYCHQQSETIGAVRSGCSLRNGAGKLPHIAMAPVALATGCPWEKGTFGGLGGHSTNSPSQNSWRVQTHWSLHLKKARRVNTVLKICFKNRCLNHSLRELWYRAWVVWNVFEWFSMGGSKVCFKAATLQPLYSLAFRGMLCFSVHPVVQQVICSHEGAGEGWWSLLTFFCLPPQWQLNGLTSDRYCVFSVPTHLKF